MKPPSRPKRPPPPRFSAYASTARRPTLPRLSFSFSPPPAMVKPTKPGKAKRNPHEGPPLLPVPLVRGASLAEGRARSLPARSRTDISNPPGRSPPPCRRARVREPEPDPGARGLSPPSRGTGARDHLKGAATAPLSPDPIPPRQRDLYPIEGGAAAPVWTPRPPTQHLGAGNGESSQ